MTAEALLIDARGHRCPVPTLKLRKALAENPEHSLFILLADDPMARIDVPHFCTRDGLELSASAPGDNHLRFEIHRSLPSDLTR